jgi:hypothetical protein
MLNIGDDWRDLLKYAWSVRLLIGAAVLSGLEVALPVIGPYLPITPLELASLLFVVVFAALIARFVTQKKFDVS